MRIFQSLANLLPEKAHIWMTPIWVWCVGAALGVVLLAAIWGVLRLAHRATATRLWEIVFEGPG
jgi:hypothetical protein